MLTLTFIPDSYFCLIKAVWAGTAAYQTKSPYFTQALPPYKILQYVLFLVAQTTPTSTGPV